MELGLAYAEVEWAYNSVGPTDSKLLETRCGGRLGGIGIFSTAKKPHPFKAQSLFERYSPRSYSITNSGSRAREFAGFADGFRSEEGSSKRLKSRTLSRHSHCLKGTVLEVIRLPIRVRVRGNSRALPTASPALFLAASVRRRASLLRKGQPD